MKHKNFLSALLMIISFIGVSFVAQAQSGDKTVKSKKKEVAVAAAEYKYTGDNYSFDVYRLDNKVEIIVKDKTGKDVTSASKLSGVVGILYSDGTQEEKPLQNLGRNKLGITTSGKTITDMRMMVDVDGDQMITGYNVASGKSHQDQH